MKKRKKVWMVVLGVFVVAGGLFATTYIPKKIISIEPTEVSRIEMFDGNRGEPLTITNKEQINHIISNLNSIVFYKEELSLFRLGYAFRIAIYDGDGDKYKEFIVNSEETIRDNGFAYRADTKEIDFTYIDSLFEKNESK